LIKSGECQFDQLKNTTPLLRFLSVARAFSLFFFFRIGKRAPIDVFLSGRFSASHVSFLLVLLQNPSDLSVKRGIYALQTLGYVFMYGGFADAEDDRGFADGVFGFDDIFSEADSPIPCVFFQK
jgi:hypothetical protein